MALLGEPKVRVGEEPGEERLRTGVPDGGGEEPPWSPCSGALQRCGGGDRDARV